MIDEVMLSVVIPVYNVSKYLPECLDRLISQMNKRCEIVLVNDGSTDASGTICKQYVIQNPEKKIVLIEQDNQGLSGARNTGILNAKGKYIVLLDSDDYLEKNSISIILQKIIKSNEPDMLLMRSKSFADGKDDFIREQCDYNSLTKKENVIEYFAELNKNKKFWFAAWLLITKKEFLLKYKLLFKKGIFHEDELWVPMVFSYAKSIAFINSTLYCYRINRSGSIINHLNIKKQFDLLLIARYLERQSKKRDKAVRKVFQERCAAIIYGRIAEYKKYEALDENHILFKSINQNLKMLNYGKYRILFCIVSAFGINRAIKFLYKHN